MVNQLLAALASELRSDISVQLFVTRTLPSTERECKLVVCHCNNLIDKILQSSNKSLKDWPSMPLPQHDWVMLVGNRMIIEQRSYDVDEQAHLAAHKIPTLNQGQRAAFDAIMKAVQEKSGQTFFLHGPGGTC